MIAVLLLPAVFLFETRDSKKGRGLPIPPTPAWRLLPGSDLLTRGNTKICCLLYLQSFVIVDAKWACKQHLLSFIVSQFTCRLIEMITRYFSQIRMLRPIINIWTSHHHYSRHEWLVIFMSSVVEFLASGFTEKQGHCQVCRTDRRGTETPFRTSDTMLVCE